MGKPDASVPVIGGSGQGPVSPYHSVEAVDPPKPIVEVGEMTRSNSALNVFSEKSDHIGRNDVFRLKVLTLLSGERHTRQSRDQDREGEYKA